MGSSRLSNALMALGEGLDVMAQGRFRTEERESDRAFQREMLASREALEQRMLELRQSHEVSMMDKQQTFVAGQTDKEMGFKREMFESEQAAVNARHAAGLAAEWARIRQAAASQASSNARADAQLKDAKEDRDLQRQLKVYEIQVQQGQNQYNGVLEAMQKELAEAAKNPMLAADSTGKKKEAERARIEAQYAPMLKEAKDEMQNGISRYSSAVGIKADFSGVESSVDSVEPTGMRDKVTAMSDAAMAQIGSGPVPPEQNLIAGFMKQGATRTEALAAARNVRSRLTQR